MDQEMSTQKSNVGNLEARTLANYPWLFAYRRGGLFSLWQQERTRILLSDPRLSEVVAGMLAQARLVVLVVDDTCTFERFVEGYDDREELQHLTEVEETLYLWLKEQWNLRYDLSMLTGLSIWLPYEEMYRAHALDERWWEALFSSPC